MPLDCSALDYIEFRFKEHRTDKQFSDILNDQFSTTLEKEDILTIFKNEDPTQGLLPNKELHVALRKIVVEQIIYPHVTDTADGATISKFVADTWFHFQKDTGSFLRLTSMLLERSLKARIATGGDVMIAIHLNIDSWTYPEDAPPVITDFALIQPKATRQSQTRSASTTPSTAINPQDTFNPHKLPPDAKARFERQRDNTGFVLGKYAETPFPASFNSDTHYYELAPPDGLILTDGTLFVCKTNIDPTLLLELQVPLTDTSPVGIRRWYGWYSRLLISQGFFVLPMYARRPYRGKWGFTVGDSPDDDLPQTMYTLINFCSGWIHQHLLSTNVLPSGSPLRRIVNAANGDGYSALLMILYDAHPTYHPTPGILTCAYPVQHANESIENYYWRFIDYLQLDAYINDFDTTLSNYNVQDIFIHNAIHSDWLAETAAWRRVHPRFSKGFTQANFLLAVKGMLQLNGSPLTNSAKSTKIENSPSPYDSGPGIWVETVPDDDEDE